MLHLNCFLNGKSAARYFCFCANYFLHAGQKGAVLWGRKLFALKVLVLVAHSSFVLIFWCVWGPHEKKIGKHSMAFCFKSMCVCHRQQQETCWNIWLFTGKIKLEKWSCHEVADCFCQKHPAQTTRSHTCKSAISSGRIFSCKKETQYI